MGVLPDIDSSYYNIRGEVGPVSIRPEDGWGSIGLIGYKGRSSLLLSKNKCKVLRSISR